MRKILAIDVVVKVATLVMILFLLTSTGGCVDIDWQLKAKQAFAVLVESTMNMAVAEYGDQKMSATAWTIKYLDQPKFDWAKPVLKWIDYEGLIEYAYDRVWANWYTGLRKAGFDTDAFTNNDSKLFALMDEGIDCPGLQDELVIMMKPK